MNPTRTNRRPVLISLGLLGVVALVGACMAYVEKTAPDDLIAAGEDAVFEIEVGLEPVDGVSEEEAALLEVGAQQLGPGDVELTDDLPDGQVWAITGDVGPQQQRCEVDTGTLEASSGVLTCHFDFEDLGEEGPFILTLTAATDEGDCGEITNTADIDQFFPTSAPVQDFAASPSSSASASAAPAAQTTDTATILVTCPTPSASASSPAQASTSAAASSSAPSQAPTSQGTGQLPNTAGGPNGGSAAFVWVSVLLLAGSLVSLAIARRRADA